MTTEQEKDDAEFEHSYAGAAIVELTDEQQLAVFEYAKTHDVSIEKALQKVTGDDGIRAS